MSDLQRISSSKYSRRDFLKITAAAGTLLAGGGLLGWGLNSGLSTLRQTRTMMGTVINLAVITEDESFGRAVIEAVFAEMERLIAYFDHRQPASLLTRLNQTGSLSDAPSELIEIIRQSIHYGHLTGGAFDISVKPVLDVYRAGGTAEQASQVPVDYRRIRLEGNRITFELPRMQLTLDGIAKGRVVDAATATLKTNGFDNVLVEAGGDLVGYGSRADGRPWQVGLANPRKSEASGLLSVLPVAGQAVATSGDYRNYFTNDFSLHHIIDPRTAVSPTDLSSVTVMAPTATEADALSTAVLVLGSGEGLALLKRLSSVEALLVTKNMQVQRTAGFP